MTDKERKHSDIMNDFHWLLDRNYKLETACQIVAFKYYISANTAYLIYAKKNKNNE